MLCLIFTMFFLDYYQHMEFYAKDLLVFELEERVL